MKKQLPKVKAVKTDKNKINDGINYPVLGFSQEEIQVKRMISVLLIASKADEVEEAFDCYTQEHEATKKQRDELIEKADSILEVMTHNVPTLEAAEGLREGLYRMATMIDSANMAVRLSAAIVHEARKVLVMRRCDAILAKHGLLDKLTKR